MVTVLLRAFSRMRSPLHLELRCLAKRLEDSGVISEDEMKYCHGGWFAAGDRLKRMQPAVDAKADG